MLPLIFRSLISSHMTGLLVLYKPFLLLDSKIYDCHTCRQSSVVFKCRTCQTNQANLWQVLQLFSFVPDCMLDIKLPVKNTSLYKKVCHLLALTLVQSNIWAASSEFGTYRLCEQQRFRRTSSESRGTFRQKARSLAPLNGWACAVKICHDGRHKFA